MGKVERKDKHHPHLILNLLRRDNLNLDRNKSKGDNKDKDKEDNKDKGYNRGYNNRGYNNRGYNKINSRDE